MTEQCLTCNNKARRGNYYCSSACCRNDSKPSASPYLLQPEYYQFTENNPIDYGYHINLKLWSSNRQIQVSNPYLYGFYNRRVATCS